MKINISKDLKALFPQFKIGIITYNHITISGSPQMVKGRLQLFQESLFFDLEEKKITEFAGIKEWRSIFKQTGKDPNKYRHSAEAMYRRIKKQNYLQSINSAADINNFFSLKYEVPIGIYDLDCLNGNIEVRVGHDGEVYEGLNGRENSLKDLIIICDSLGPFGSPFVDSTRTNVNEQTTNALQVVFLRHSIEVDEAQALLHSLKDMFIQVHGGSGQVEVIV